MIYEFKSRAAGTVVMTQAVAENILQLIGKSPGAQGVITVEQIPAAIQTLEAAIAREKAEIARARAAPGAAKDDDAVDEDGQPLVSLGQRAYPFIDLLRQSGAAGREVTWGV